MFKLKGGSIMMLRILFYLLITLTLCSCGVSDAMKKANEAKAMSQLKKFYSGQMINMIENEGSLISFKALYENKYYGEFIDEDLYRAWDGSPEPEAQNGYFYSEIITGPVTSWPSESDLQSRWIKVKKRRTGESIDINKMMSEQLREMR